MNEQYSYDLNSHARGIKDDSSVVLMHPRHVEFFEDHLHQLRTFDDKAGGSRGSLWFVEQSLTTVKRCLAYADSATMITRKQLHAISSQLQQLLGWMAHDINKHKLATAYFRAALHSARKIGDIHFAAYVTTCMAHEAVYDGRIADGVELAERAREKAKEGPPALRALVASRLALASGAAGNETALRAATDEARYHIADPDAMTTRPSWLYWFHENVLDVIEAQNTFVFAQTQPNAEPELVEAAKEQMQTRLEDHTLTHHSDRIVLGMWLARSHVWDGDIEAGVATGNTLLMLPPRAWSPRAKKSLYQLHQDVSHDKYRGNQMVKEFRKRTLGKLRGIGITTPKTALVFPLADQ